MAKRSSTSGAPTVVVVIPTYNEAENVAPFVERVFSVLPDAHILIVDDNSPDGTAAIVVDLQKRMPQLHLLRRARKLGLGSAYVAGFARVLPEKFDVIFQMDCDFSHDPAYAPAMLEALRDSDVVIGSRYCPGGGTRNWNALRRSISAAGSRYAQSIFPELGIVDHTAGYKCFRREVLERIDLGAIRTNGYGFQIEMNVRAHALGFSLGEVPIVFEDRRVGKSKLSRTIIAEAALAVPLLRIAYAVGGLAGK